MNRTKVLLIAVACAVLIIGGWLAYRARVYRTEVSEYKLEAVGADANGIAPDARFVLSSSASLTPQVIEKYLAFSPKVDFDVKGSSATNTYEIVPKNPLAADAVYTLAIARGPLAARAYSWAYQVKAPFGVVSSIPADKGSQVPVRTGIELRFNREDISSPDKFVSITPAVAGRFETAGSLVRFVPNDPLDYRTVYTVTVKPGLGARDTADTLQEEVRIRFETQAENSYETDNFAYFSSHMSEFAPGGSIAIQMNAGRSVSSVGVTVYRLPSSRAYVDSITKSEGDEPWMRYASPAKTNFPETQKVFSGSLPLERADYLSLVRLPYNLPNGYYAIVAEAGKVKDVSWFQVNPAASYAAFSSGKSLIWLKDIATEAPLPNVPILFGGKVVGKTGADGVALFGTPAELVATTSDPYYFSQGKRSFFTADVPGGALAIPMEGEYGYSRLLSRGDMWWDYVSLNKNVYLPTDTVRFWAIQKPRGGGAISGDVNVRLSDPYWSDTENNVTVYGEKNVKLSEFGALTGEIGFENLKPGLYELSFRKNGETISRQTLTVASYLKPAYKLSLEPTKTAIFAGETATFKLKAELFDGTPVSNMSFTYRAYGAGLDGAEGAVTVNAKGEGSFSIAPKYVESSYWPSYAYVDVRPAAAEEGRIETNAAVAVFGPHILNTVTETRQGGRATFSVKTRAVSISGTAREPYWDSESYLGAAIPGALTRMDISEVIYRSEKTGTGYDPINKLTYPIYKYWTEERAVESRSLVADQGGVATASFDPEKGKTYKVAFVSSDDVGRVVKDTWYVYGGYFGMAGDDKIVADDRSVMLQSRDDGRKEYHIGDKVSVQLRGEGGYTPSVGVGKFAFLSVRNGDISYRVQDSPEYEAAFGEADVPNVQIFPAWFSGGRFRSSYAFNAAFASDDKRLNVSVTKDRASYAPGGKAVLDVRVTDKNGAPVRAEVNVSALDEAVFSISPDERDIVSDLYRGVYSQVIVRTSNVPPSQGGGAEKGGGDGDGPRSKFNEVAVFTSVTTDASGRARVEVKLPDSITSWRITSQAVTKDLHVGKSVAFLPVTLPFFVDATMNESYLSGDRLVLRLRTFGVSSGVGSVNYTVESGTLPFKKVESVAGASADVPVGTLIAGTHDITVRAKNGANADSIARKLSVVDSYFTAVESKTYVGKPGLTISNDAAGLTTLMFGSAGRDALYGELRSLRHSWGKRLDQRGSTVAASRLLESYFGEKSELSDMNLGAYQSGNGGMQLLPYSSDDLELSAVAAHLLDDVSVDVGTLRTYLAASIRDGKTDVHRAARALYGLSAFHEPVLVKLQQLRRERSLDLADKAFVALALDTLGAKEEARQVFEEDIRPAIKSQRSYAYVSGLKGDDTITTTALVAALAASLEEPGHAKLAAYAMDNHPKETLANFELLTYVKKVLPALDPQEVSFAYELRGKTERKTLHKGEHFSLTLSKQDLATFRLAEVTGTLGVSATYEIATAPAAMAKSNDIRLTRSYEVGDVMRTEFKEGDLVRVRLNPQYERMAPKGAYQIVDHAPSGLRPVDQESFRYYSGDRRVYPSEIDGQKVTFIVDPEYRSAPIYYMARVVSKGTYKAEPALLQSLRSLDVSTLSNEDAITVK